ncbi:MAG: ribosome-associated translation inhibitor RaiA [Chloroflexota bacterium]|nr:ribosome-associated translation inhibitor RaiA [Chloroflexota bacterium]MDE2635094.1 ribosome-associated translation inhibitor RaiA [Chloroflexota bacterium]
MMNISIHGDGIKISDALDSYTRSKVDKLDRYLPNISQVGVELSIIRTHRGADLAIAQITVQHARGAILRAEEKMNIESRDTIRSAINKAVDKLHRQIDRFKSKRKSKNQKVRDRYRATVAELDLAEDAPVNALNEAEESDATSEIYRRKQIEMMPMNEEEAIEQLELLDHTFYMFMNAESDQVNVLYRRESGGYGILVPL